MIVFLVRHFNDIDHIVPIVYRMLKDQAAELSVFCMDPVLDVGNDFRLMFLKKRFGCQPRYIYQAHTPTILHRLFAILVCALPYWKMPVGLRWFSRVSRRVARRVYGSAWRGRLYNVEWAEAFLRDSGVDCLVVDFGEKRKFIYAPIADAVSNLGVRLIGVSPGMDTQSNLYWTNRDLSAPQVLAENWSWITEFIVEGHGTKDKYAKRGFSAESMTVLGNTRYCEEWLQVYHGILPPQPLPCSGTGKLKVVYMDHAAVYRANTENIVASLRALAQLDYTDLIVKAHPRVGLSDPRLAEFGRVDSETHSVHLIDWADVVMSFGSSIVIEAYNLNKIFIYPKYFHQNQVRWEDYGACWTVDSQGELLSALKDIHEGTHRLPYGEDQIRAFLTDTVYGGDPSRDVLGDYVDFIVGGGRTSEYSAAVHNRRTDR